VGHDSTLRGNTSGHYLAVCFAAEADSALMARFSALDHEKPSRLPAGPGSGQLQLGSACTYLSRIQILSEPRNPLAA
jgi:hypothetical protein